jgi:hypothetical protein
MGLSPFSQGIGRRIIVLYLDPSYAATGYWAAPNTFDMPKMINM